MSSVVISGDTSGSITLSAPAVAGSNTLTLPASTGIIATEGVGQGQTWQNVTASRTSGTTYTNSTGRPIQVNASIVVGSNGSSLLQVNGVNVSSMNNQFGDRNLTTTMSAIVPNGSTYGVTAGTVNFWSELS